MCALLSIWLFSLHHHTTTTIVLSLHSVASKMAVCPRTQLHHVTSLPFCTIQNPKTRVLSSRFPEAGGNHTRLSRFPQLTFCILCIVRIVCVFCDLCVCVCVSFIHFLSYDAAAGLGSLSLQPPCIARIAMLVLHFPQQQVECFDCMRVCVVVVVVRPSFDHKSRGWERPPSPSPSLSACARNAPTLKSRLALHSMNGMPPNCSASSWPSALLTCLPAAQHGKRQREYVCRFGCSTFCVRARACASPLSLFVSFPPPHNPPPLPLSL